MAVVDDKITSRRFSLRFHATDNYILNKTKHIGFSLQSIVEIDAPENDWNKNGRTNGISRTQEATFNSDWVKLRECITLDAHPTDRHYLLQHIVVMTFRDQNPISRGKPKRLTTLSEEKARDFCEAAAWQWLVEWPAIHEALVAEFGSVPNILILKRLAGVLRIRGDKIRAAEVALMDAHLEDLK